MAEVQLHSHDASTTVIRPLVDFEPSNVGKLLYAAPQPAEPVKVLSAISKLIDRIEQSAPMDVAGRGKYLHDLRALLARYGQPDEERGFLTITWDEDKIAAVTRQDEDGKVLSIIAVSGNPPFNPKEIKPCGF